MTEQDVANALTVSQFLGIGGAAITVVCQYRFGRTLPILLGVWGGAYGIFMITGAIDGSAYWVGVGLFNLLWNLFMPYMLAILAKFDDHGRFVSQGTAMQFIGYAVGPYIAAQIAASEVASSSFDGVNISAVVIFVVAALLILPASRSA